MFIHIQVSASLSYTERMCWWNDRDTPCHASLLMNMHFKLQASGGIWIAVKSQIALNTQCKYLLQFPPKRIAYIICKYIPTPSLS